LESLQSGVPLPPLSAELNALRFGDVALVTAPGEIFTETGLEVKRRSPLPRTCYIAYTNGAIGYVPVPSAYSEGGYEVTHACQVGPEAANIITETSLTLLNQVTVGEI
jgi:neutral ceramidase